MFSDSDIAFMKEALSLAIEAEQNQEVPVGAVIVKDNKVIGKGRNKIIFDQDISSHAEIVAIRDASKNISNYRLNNCKMFVTLEPCHMCAKAIVDARIDSVIFAASEPKSGSLVSVDNFFERISLNHRVTFEMGLLEKESSDLLKSFFKARRG
ncbi:tRNA adenosine(34) deaminase TadA [Gammaproteobacteria bacterium]|jgi:tRNA(adenine34) deaminase|nr:tRNA adenosine(34) deaminase TadA [Gammaproteobacteria bacterium]